MGNSLSFPHIQPKTNLQVEVRRTVFEVVANMTAVIEVVLDARLSIKTQLRDDVILHAQGSTY